MENGEGSADAPGTEVGGKKSGGKTDVAREEGKCNHFQRRKHVKAWVKM